MRRKHLWFSTPLVKRFYRLWDTICAPWGVQAFPLLQVLVTRLTILLSAWSCVFNYNIIKYFHKQTIQPKNFTSKQYFRSRSMAQEPQVGISEKQLISAACTGSTPCIEPPANLLQPSAQSVCQSLPHQAYLLTLRLGGAAAVGQPAFGVCTRAPSRP